MARKADLGLNDKDDDAIIEHIDDLMLYLVARIGEAQMAGNTLFLERFAWLIEAFNQLDAAQRVSRLDG